MSDDTTPNRGPEEAGRAAPDSRGAGAPNKEESALGRRVRETCEAMRARGQDVKVKDVALELGVRTESVNDHVTRWKDESPPFIAACIVRPADQKAVAKMVRDLVEKVAEVAEARVQDEIVGITKKHEEDMAKKDAELAEARQREATAIADSERMAQEVASKTEALARSERLRTEENAASRAKIERLQHEKEQVQHEKEQVVAENIRLEARYQEAHKVATAVQDKAFRRTVEAEDLRHKLALAGGGADPDDPGNPEI